MSDQEGVKTKGMLALETDKTTEGKTEAAANETGMTAEESKKRQKIDMKSLLEYLQGRFDEKNKKMNEHNEQMNKKMDEESQRNEKNMSTLTSRFQRIEDNLKTQSQRHTETEARYEETV